MFCLTTRSHTSGCGVNINACNKAQGNKQYFCYENYAWKMYNNMDCINFIQSPSRYFQRCLVYFCTLQTKQYALLQLVQYACIQCSHLTTFGISHIFCIAWVKIQMEIEEYLTWMYYLLWECKTRFMELSIHFWEFNMFVFDNVCSLKLQYFFSNVTENIISFNKISTK